MNCLPSLSTSGYSSTANVRPSKPRAELPGEQHHVSDGRCIEIRDHHVGGRPLDGRREHPTLGHHDEDALEPQGEVRRRARARRGTCPRGCRSVRRRRGCRPGRQRRSRRWRRCSTTSPRASVGSTRMCGAALVPALSARISRSCDTPAVPPSCPATNSDSAATSASFPCACRARQPEHELQERRGCRGRKCRASACPRRRRPCRSCRPCRGR